MSSQTPNTSQSDFWTTPQGLDARLDAISHQLVYRALNAGIVLFTEQILPIDVEEAYDWDTAGDEAVCDTCAENEEGGPYTQDDLPDFPAHPHCRCMVSVLPEAIGEVGEVA